MEHEHDTEVSLIAPQPVEPPTTSRINPTTLVVNSDDTDFEDIHLQQIFQKKRMLRAIKGSGGILAVVYERLVLMLNLEKRKPTRPLTISGVQECINSKGFAQAAMLDEQREVRGKLEAVVYKRALGTDGQPADPRMALSLLSSDKFAHDNDGDKEYGSTLTISPKMKHFSKLSNEQLMDARGRARNVASIGSLTGRTFKRDAKKE